jgi:hypothetical protein
MLYPWKLMTIESDVKAIAGKPERTGLIETLTQTLLFATNFKRNCISVEKD